MDTFSVTLSWKSPEHDGGSPLTEYVIEHRESPHGIWVKSACVSPDELSYESNNLKGTIDYFFRVSAKNKHGVSKSIETGSSVRPKSKFGKYLS